ncbi:MAG: glycosyltransferase family 2 protein [Lachnospiraceae bacterium]|nr:glycosyltransferase family 2 protein [Lachnospiraceae bacterium]
MKIIDIVVPAYNEVESIPAFHKEVQAVAETLPDYRFEYIFVDDGSSDGTRELLCKMAAADDCIKYISFSRNFGKEAAIHAGLSHAYGDMVILMDADLQHPPALIPEMVRTVDIEGYGACGAKRHPKLSSRMFAGLNNKMSSVKLQKGATDYMCMSRAFVDAVLKLAETQRFTKGLFAWVGFKVKWLDYVQNPREHGKSRWSLRKLFLYATDGLTAFSVVPLRLLTIIGAIVSLLAFIYIIVTLVKTIICGIDVPGYVTTLCAVLFLGGIILLGMGILGDYIGRIYLESKKRPLYILEETNIEKPDEQGKR